MTHRILLVDDAQIMRMMMGKVFKEAGYEIVGQASTGVEAVEKYLDLRPDLVMMDITMPEMSGIEAVKEIMELDPKAKIIMCSAMGQKSMVLESIEAGARNFIIKPFEPQKLLDIVRAVLAE